MSKKKKLKIYQQAAGSRLSLGIGHSSSQSKLPIRMQSIQCRVAGSIFGKFVVRSLRQVNVFQSLLFQIYDGIWHKVIIFHSQFVEYCWC